jgi:hypothetical protein
MVTLTQTQRIIAAVVIIVVCGALGWAADKYLLKSDKALMYAGIGLVVGVAIDAALYFFVVKKNSGASPGVDARLAELNRPTIVVADPAPSTSYLE